MDENATNGAHPCDDTRSFVDEREGEYIQKGEYHTVESRERERGSLRESGRRSSAEALRVQSPHSLWVYLQRCKTAHRLPFRSLRPGGGSSRRRGGESAGQISPLHGVCLRLLQSQRGRAPVVEESGKTSRQTGVWCGGDNCGRAAGGRSGV